MMRTSIKRAMLIFALCALCGVALVGGVVSAFFGLPHFASFECAFIGFSLILFASFFGIIKQVQRTKEEALLAELNAQKQESTDSQNGKKSSTNTQDSKESVTESTNLIKSPSMSTQAKCNEAKATSAEAIQSKETQIPFTSRFLVGVKLSFSFLRLLCYIGFTFALIGLLESKLFEPLSFLIGSIASVVIILIIALQSLYHNEFNFVLRKLSL